MEYYEIIYKYSNYGKEVYMEHIINILKGVVIGVANAIPGVSGGTMMVAMGIYDKLIHCITHLFSELKKNVLFLAPIAVGMGVAVIASSFTIEKMFKSFPFQTVICGRSRQVNSIDFQKEGQESPRNKTLVPR